MHQVVVADDAGGFILDGGLMLLLSAFAFRFDRLHDVTPAAVGAVVGKHFQTDPVGGGGPKNLERLGIGKIVGRPDEQLARADEVVPHGEGEPAGDVAVRALRAHAGRRLPVLRLLHFLVDRVLHHVAGKSAEIVGREIVVRHIDGGDCRYVRTCETSSVIS